jgi:hypothetical protein
MPTYNRYSFARVNMQRPTMSEQLLKARKLIAEQLAVLVDDGSLDPNATVDEAIRILRGE